MNKIKSIFIANRGEIAVRIIKTARVMGIRAVTAYTLNDKKSLHIQMADKVVCLDINILNDTFLSPERMVAVAKEENCDAIHPGYGFLSEDYRFAELCKKYGLIFIGPTPDVLKTMGIKTEAKKLVELARVPVLSGLERETEELIKYAKDLNYPLTVKAVAGGGGKGLRKVLKADELKKEVNQASREALNYFGDGRVYIEPFLENTRHIEVQLLGDQYGNLIH
ncbi:MAG: acetyl-CoA carboxylase biotin carboxylase subunit, partial [Mariniphaga sp.]|nr:acetyl-CoA carboxylase biotin carboxylase subunit [Mariniphaga sp.]